MFYYTSIDEIKAANRNAGKFFFSDGAMRFFNSRIDDRVWGGRYFITSEQFDEKSPRLYTIRAIKEDGSTEQISEFQEYATLDAAVNILTQKLQSGELRQVER